MGSQSDYHVMKKCEEILKILKIKYETKIVSAHRTPDRMFSICKTAEKIILQLLLLELVDLHIYLE